MTVKHREDYWINELSGALADPIIVYPGGWGDDTPDWLKQQATIERMLIMKTGPEEMSTDAEAAIYLMSASLDAPLGRDWTEIYLYVCQKELRAHGTIVPADLNVEKISGYQMSELIRLKRWIYNARKRFREKIPREKLTTDQRNDKGVKQPKKEKFTQQNMFDFSEVKI